MHVPPIPISHIRQEWQGPACRGYYKALADGRRLVRFDHRGAGLSDRDVQDVSLDAHVRDLEAVVDRLGFDRVALLGFVHSGPVAIAYAAAHPDRVSHLILWNSYANAADYSRSPRVEAARSLIEHDWHLYTEMEGYRYTEWVGGDEARWYTEYLRAAVTPDYLMKAFASIRQTDVSPMVSQVLAPTLVIHRRDLAVLAVDTARDLASRIRDARLVLIDGPWLVPFMGGGTAAVAGAIDTFLRAAEEPAPEARPAALTPRETEVLRLIAAGRTSSEISRELSLSIRTVGRHITNIYAKIGARTRSDATAYAIRQRLT